MTDLFLNPRTRFFDRRNCGRRAALMASLLAVVGWLPCGVAGAARIWAGAAKADITDRQAKPVNDPLYVKALVLRADATTVVLVTVDAVAIGELGRIKNDFLANVRSELRREWNIPPSNILINASHCHGIVCAEVRERTVHAVKEAFERMVPVRVGAGAGEESRISENRRLSLRDGRQADVRHAYSLPPDEDVAGIGPIDPQIGLLRLDRESGQPLAVVYNFACHPIQGVPSGANTADITGFASKAIEESLGHGAIALFVQGAAGDINPAWYRDVRHPRDAEPLGNMLGLSAARALKDVKTTPSGDLRVVHEVLALPRGTDLEQRISAMQAEQTRLLRSLRGTSLNLKTFVPLFVQYQVSGDYPSYDGHAYRHEEAIGRQDLKSLDAANRANLQRYIRNVHIMEELTRIQVNMDLLKKHQARNAAAGSPTIDVEIAGLRVGDFHLVTFPGELTVEIGLGIKKRAPAPFTFVAGYTNGYIYYAPTEKQRNNSGFGQEDCDCLLAPEWQKLYEERVDAILKKLAGP